MNNNTKNMTMHTQEDLMSMDKRELAKMIMDMEKMNSKDNSSKDRDM